MWSTDYDVPDLGEHEHLRCSGCGRYFHPSELTKISGENYCEKCEDKFLNESMEDESEVL